MAEGNETPGGESAPAGRRSEGDLFSERRARRAAESGEVALTRRAEAAEATVQTLERHVSSLQQRLREAEDEQARMAELIDVEKAAALEREHELRRVKQREYAEQQLRVEAEERLTGLGRESHAESEQLSRRLSASEDDTRELAGRLESLQRQLAEAEQAAAAERAAVRRAEHELQARLRDLEARAVQMQHGLESERSARERTEGLLEGMRLGHIHMTGLLGDMKALVARLSVERAQGPPAASPAAAPVTPAAAQAAPQATAAAGLPEPLQPAWDASAVARGAQPTEPRGAEMAQALAAAVERLRARAEAAPPPEVRPAAPAVVRAPHRHSMSLITRWRIRRKQRRSR